MESKASFDLDYTNNPVVKLEIKSTLDVRDKIAKRFIESLGTISQWCSIYPIGDQQWIIQPITTSELRQQAENILQRTNDLEK